MTSVSFPSLLVGLLLAAFQQNPGYAGEPGGAYVRSAEISARAPAADAQSHAQRGLALLNRGNFDEAIAEYSTAISSDPSNASAFAGRGRAYVMKDQYDKGLADFDRAIRLAPQDSAAFKYRGLVYSLKGRPDRAIRDLDEAIRLDPHDVGAMEGRGSSYVLMGDFGRGIADFDQVIKLNPQDASAFHGRGIAYDHKGDYDRAIADYNEAIRLNPTFAGAYHERGFARYTKGDYDRAIADYDEAIRLNSVPETYRNRGLAYLYAGQLANAQADMKKATELNPKDAYPAIWLDIVERRSGAATHLSEAASQMNMTAWPAPVVRMLLGQSTLAAVLAAAEDPDAVKRKGQVCEANFYGGEFLLQQGTKDEAARLFSAAASDCPRDFFEVGAAVGELKALGVKPVPG